MGMTFEQVSSQSMRAGTKRQAIPVRNSKFYYIPLLDTLKALLQNPDVLDEVLNRQSSSLLTDFCNGRVVCNHPIFKGDKLALQIVAYYDDIEVCNPLGAAAKKHKIGAFFYFLANISPKHRSSLNVSQLFAIAKTSDIKKHGIDAVLKPFVEDLKKLSSDGIVVSLNSGTSHSFKGSLVAFLADNLASHTLGGFKESMAFAFRLCRKCMATKEQSQLHFHSSAFKLRTHDEHIKQCQLLTGPLKDHYSTTYGVCRNSILNTLPNFSVTSGLCNDVMHDLFEGVVPLELKLLIQHCVSEDYFTVAVLNDCILKFDFGYSNASDRPHCFEESASGKIKLKAVSMWLLSRMLPIIIGEKIPADDKHWQCYCILLKIIDICTSHECSLDSAAYLSTLIEEHHSAFVDLYKDKFIPKMHYMVHYPNQIADYGPMIHSWCMRMESKLKLIKRVSKFGNFKNICYSVAQSHQRWMCYQLQSATFLNLPPEIGGRNEVRMFEEEDSVLQSIINRDIGSTVHSSVNHPSWVKVCSTQFKKGAVVMTECLNGQPVFAKIVDIVVISHEVWLIVNTFVTNHFDNHFHAFCVTTSSNVRAVHLLTLKYPFVLHDYALSHQSFDRYIVLKYGLAL